MVDTKKYSFGLAKKADDMNFFGNPAAMVKTLGP